MLYGATFSVLFQSFFSTKKCFYLGGGIIQNDTVILREFIFIYEINEHISPYLVDKIFLFLLVIMKNIYAKHLSEHCLPLWHMPYWWEALTNTRMRVILGVVMCSLTFSWDCQLTNNHMETSY